jgi:hypothetical protein
MLSMIRFMLALGDVQPDDSFWLKLDAFNSTMKTLEGNAGFPSPEELAHIFYLASKRVIEKNAPYAALRNLALLCHWLRGQRAQEAVNTLIDDYNFVFEKEADLPVAMEVFYRRTKV